MRRSFFAVASEEISEEERSVLRRYVARTVLLPADARLASPVSRHPDMIFSVLDDVLFTHEEYYRTARSAIDEICALGGLRLRLSSMERGAAYPRDIGFNALLFSTRGGRKILMGACRYLSPELVSFAVSSGREIVSVKQGYTACSALVLEREGVSSLIVAADGGIAAACESVGAEVFRISPASGVRLPGYDVGFIGGASGAYGDTAFFYGNPRRHPTLVPLCEEIERRGFTIVSLSEETLTDRGGLRLFPMNGE